MVYRKFIQFLCYRKNVEFSKVELAAPCENGTHETFAELYVLDEGVDTEIQTLKDGRYIKQAYISGHEGQILSDIASEKLYLRHLPDSFQSGKHIDAARFVMITAAFEWEFDRLFPDGICKSKERVEAELIVSQKLNELIDTSSGIELYRYGQKAWGPEKLFCTWRLGQGFHWIILVGFNFFTANYLCYTVENIWS